MFTKLALAVSRLVELVLLVLGIAALVQDNNVPVLLFWDLLALIYLGIRIARVSRSRKIDHTDSRWLKGVLGRRLGLLFTLLTSLVGVTSGLSIVLPETAGIDPTEAKIVGVPAVLLAWAILHFGYAERYAQMYYDSLPTRHFSFPETERPTLADFTYFAFTIGTSFAVSDVETRTTPIRSLVLAHSVLSFMYNTATLGIAVSVITGGH
ncbi:DUF1345 domain-containing protein [Amycolatopsis sp. AA4]|uniref:DUF1345 domain-containing protein n=1 Tax=Actinomycetes TaxID=1760 RepID=UPI0001B5652B|nr:MULTISPECIES: DUF1345 domain-containing protein [Actinomycetes]ATY10218.1 DUF1345 domain-containing protein [Amycolatopsis sp. AA4]EFL05675.1 predicted protein [Streptomyces sp. AA4]